MEKIDPATAGGDALADRLRLFEIVPDADLKQYQVTGQINSFSGGSIAGGGTEIVTLGAHRNWNSGSRAQENLYQIRIDNQTFLVSSKPPQTRICLWGLWDPPSPQFTGLWVGEVALDNVSSLTEAGAPKQAATTKLPLQVILHVDTNGATSLLSHVMLMQTKTADDTINADMVLVVDETKIPFFEGIEERGGKRVGRRLETVSFDMPRITDLATQTNLLDDVVAETPGFTNVAQVAESNLVAFINSRSSRPPDLVESYHLTWRMRGGVGPGNGVETPSDKPLTQDPFHRSNPFRHAFHPQHGAGLPIERTIRMGFDDTLEAGRLTGLYEETTTGLTKMPIQTQGRFVLERVTEVGVLH